MSMFLSSLRNVLQILKSILLCLEEFSEHSKGGVLSLDEITVLQGRKLSLQKEVSLLGNISFLDDNLLHERVSY